MTASCCCLCSDCKQELEISEYPKDFKIWGAGFEPKESNETCPYQKNVLSVLNAFGFTYAVVDDFVMFEGNKNKITDPELEDCRWIQYVTEHNVNSSSIDGGFIYTQPHWVDFVFCRTRDKEICGVPCIGARRCASPVDSDECRRYQAFITWMD
jgi:hypothetical protein